MGYSGGSTKNGTQFQMLKPKFIKLRMIKPMFYHVDQTKQ